MATPTDGRGEHERVADASTVANTPGPMKATPLWASMGFTFSASAGSMIVQSGIFFLTTSTYKFGTVENYALGVTQGVTYIAGALGAGPLLGLLRRRVPGISSRTVLISMMLAMTLLCMVPKVALGGTEAGATSAHWPIWVLVMVYSPTSGMLWPMVESYIAGGRSGKSLRSTIGWWNVVWSSSLIVSSVLMAPFVKSAAADLIFSLSVVHAGCALLVLRFGREPLPHPHESAHEVPANYPKLLVTFRWLLPLSYAVTAAMIPFLPTLMNTLEIAVDSHTIFAATWLLFRTAGFVMMERFHAWHGKWWHPALAMALTLAGFAAVALCHVAGGAEYGKIILLAGLACFGLGMAAIYAGAIYYAMEVGQAEVEAGGAHESLIGVGYTVGPAIGLGAALAVEGKALRADFLEPAVLVVIAALSVVVAGIVARRIQKLGGGRSA